MTRRATRRKPALSLQEERRAEWDRYVAERISRGLPPYTNPNAGDGEARTVFSSFAAIEEQKAKDQAAASAKRREKRKAAKATMAVIRDDRPRLSIPGYKRIHKEIGTKEGQKLLASRWTLEGNWYRLRPELVLAKPRVISLPPTAAKRDVPKDDLAAKLAEYTHKKDGVDRAKLVKLAKANKVWDAKYDKLGDGLARMNVGNRLRAMFRKNVKIVWP